MESKLPAGSPGHSKVQYAYDHANRMTRRETWKWIGGTWVSQKRDHFLWQGWNIIAEVSTIKSMDIILPVRRGETQTELTIRTVARSDRHIAELLCISHAVSLPRVLSLL